MISHGNCQFPQHPDYQNLLNINNKFYEEKIELQKKVHRRICVRFITFLAALPPSYFFFLFFFFFLSFPILQLTNFFFRKCWRLTPLPPQVSTALILHLYISLKKFCLSRNIRNVYAIKKVNLYFLTLWKILPNFLFKSLPFSK